VPLARPCSKLHAPKPRQNLELFHLAHCGPECPRYLPRFRSGSIATETRWGPPTSCSFPRKRPNCGDPGHVSTVQEARQLVGSAIPAPAVRPVDRPRNEIHAGAFSRRRYFGKHRLLARQQCPGSVPSADRCSRQCWGDYASNKMPKKMATEPPPGGRSPTKACQSYDVGLSSPLKRRSMMERTSMLLPSAPTGFWRPPPTPRHPVVLGFDQKTKPTVCFLVSAKGPSGHEKFGPAPRQP